MTRNGGIALTAAILLGVLTCGLLGVSPARADGVAELPELPVPRDRCVEESARVLTQRSWAQDRVASRQVMPLTRGQGVVVAVLDTGVSAIAPALRGAVLPGIDVVGGGNANRDCLGRGTALAGLVAARPVDGTSFVGVAPAATILPIRIVDGRGEMPSGSIARGINAAVTGGADVILLGTGTPGATPDLRRAVSAAVTHGTVIVAAVATAADRADAPVVWYPAAYPQVIAVGAVDPQGRVVGRPAENSGVDLAGPGGGAASIGPSGRGHYRVGGSGVAAAYVAGVAALMRSYQPDLDPDQVRERLGRTAEPASDKSMRPWVGAGMVDAFDALAATRVGATPFRELPAQPVVVPQPPPRPRSVALGLTLSAATAVATALALAAIATGRQWRRRRAQSRPR
ncbi:S8 family serine peptidase [Micromonospora sp. NPDC047548]|uniref:S8 family serine peptidase n=1 Tax=Micromonospora sp. NPDC047548 TaxID=3155624 RepID=UPI0033FA39E2